MQQNPHADVRPVQACLWREYRSVSSSDPNQNNHNFWFLRSFIPSRLVPWFTPSHQQQTYSWLDMSRFDCFHGGGVICWRVGSTVRAAVPECERRKSTSLQADPVLSSLTESLHSYQVGLGSSRFDCRQIGPAAATRGCTLRSHALGASTKQLTKNSLDYFSLSFTLMNARDPHHSCRSPHSTCMHKLTHTFICGQWPCIPARTSFICLVSLCVIVS